MSGRLEMQRLSDEREDEQPTELAAAIRAVRARRPCAEDVESLAARLSSQLSAANVQAVNVRAGVGIGGVARWLVTMIAVAGIATFTTLMVGRPRPLPAPLPNGSAPDYAPKVERAQNVVPALNPEAAPRPAADSGASGVEVTSPRAAASRPLRSARLTARGALQPSAAASNPEAELALLQRAHAALSASPVEALALTDQHRLQYASGLFAQEREVIAIEALLALSRKPAAILRARAFLAKYPLSPHARRVRPLLERAESTTNSAGTDHP